MKDEVFVTVVLVVSKGWLCSWRETVCMPVTGPVSTIPTRWLNAREPPSKGMDRRKVPALARLPGAGVPAEVACCAGVPAGAATDAVAAAAAADNGDGLGPVMVKPAGTPECCWSEDRDSPGWMGMETDLCGIEGVFSCCGAFTAPDFWEAVPW